MPPGHSATDLRSAAGGVVWRLQLWAHLQLRLSGHARRQARQAGSCAHAPFSWPALLHAADAGSLRNPPAHKPLAPALCQQCGKALARHGADAQPPPPDRMCRVVQMEFQATCAEGVSSKYADKQGRRPAGQHCKMQPRHSRQRSAHKRRTGASWRAPRRRQLLFQPNAQNLPSTTNPEQTQSRSCAQQHPPARTCAA